MDNNKVSNVAINELVAELTTILTTINKEIDTINNSCNEIIYASQTLNSYNGQMVAGTKKTVTLQETETQMSVYDKWNVWNISNCDEIIALAKNVQKFLNSIIDIMPNIDKILLDIQVTSDTILRERAILESGLNINITTDEYRADNGDWIGIKDKNLKWWTDGELYFEKDPNKLGTNAWLVYQIDENGNKVGMGWTDETTKNAYLNIINQNKINEEKRILNGAIGNDTLKNEIQYLKKNGAFSAVMNGTLGASLIKEEIKRLRTLNNNSSIAHSSQNIEDSSSDTSTASLYGSNVNSSSDTSTASLYDSNINSSFDTSTASLYGSNVNSSSDTSTTSLYDSNENSSSNIPSSPLTKSTDNIYKEFYDDGSIKSIYDKENGISYQYKENGDGVYFKEGKKIGSFVRETGIETLYNDNGTIDTYQLTNENDKMLVSRYDPSTNTSVQFKPNGEFSVFVNGKNEYSGSQTNGEYVEFDDNEIIIHNSNNNGLETYIFDTVTQKFVPEISIEKDPNQTVSNLKTNLEELAFFDNEKGIFVNDKGEPINKN